MRLNEAIEAYGTFWLPNNPERKASGTLHISRSGEVKVNLIGILGDPIQTLNRRLNHQIGFVKKEWDVIHGTVAGHRRVTLYQCWDTGSISGAANTSTIQADYALLGWQFERSDDIEFNNLFITVAGLEQWLQISGFSIDYRNDFSDFSIHTNTPKNIQVPLSHQRILEFCFDFAHSNVRFLDFKADIRQRAYISYKESQPLDLERAVQIIMQIRDFLSYAMDRKLPITSITAHSAEAVAISDDGQSHPRLIKMFYRSGNHDAPERSVNPHSMLFTYHDVAEQLGAIIGSWFKLLESAGTPVNLYFAAVNNPSHFLEADYLTIVRAIETIHRSLWDHDEMAQEEFEKLREAILSKFDTDSDIFNWLTVKLQWANQLKLVNRIDELISPFKSHFGNHRQRKKFAGLAVKTRDQLMHVGDSDLGLEGKSETILILMLKLEVLFKLTLLQSMGFETELIESIIERNTMIQEVLKLPLKSSANS